MKKILLLAALLLISSFAFADSIVDYTVPSTIPLNTNLTIYGVYDATSNSEILCSFFIFDTVDGNKLVIRLSDEYTLSDGTFSSLEYQITAPLFRRGFDYNAFTKCGSTTVSTTFYVDQKEELVAGITPENVRWDILWFVNPENTQTLFLVGLFILVIAFIGFGLANDIKTVSLR